MRETGVSRTDRGEKHAAGPRHLSALVGVPGVTVLIPAAHEPSRAGEWLALLLTIFPADPSGPTFKPPGPFAASTVAPLQWVRKKQSPMPPAAPAGSENPTPKRGKETVGKGETVPMKRGFCGVRGAGGAMSAFRRRDQRQLMRQKRERSCF